MAAIIKIKRGTLTANPASSLADGEIGYATNNDASFGNRLYIGNGGSSDDAIVIGGKYFTDIIDAKTSSNTASTLVERDSSGNFAAGTITANLTGNVTGDVTGNADTASAWETARTITLAGDLGGSVSVDGSGDVTLTATVQADSVALGTDTTGNYVATIADAGNSNITVANSGSETAGVTLDLTDTAVTAGQYGSTSAVPVITVDAKGRVTALSTSTITTSFDIAADSGTQDTVAGGEALTFTGGEGIDTAVTNNTITISAEDASDTNKGVATFNSADFAVSSGDVTIKSGGVSNAQLAGSIENGKLVNSAITIGSDSVSLGGTQTDLNGITSLDVDIITIDSNTISTTNSNGNLVLDPNGSGIVSVSGGLTVTGDLTVTGTTTTVESTTVTIDDPILSLADNNTSGDTVDIGFYGTYNDGATKHTGFFRDATDGEYYLVTGIASTDTPGTTFTFTESTDLAAMNAIIDGGTF